MAHAAYAAELVTKLCARGRSSAAVYDWLAALLGLPRRGGGQRRTAARVRAGAARRARLRSGRRPLRGVRRDARPTTALPLGPRSGRRGLHRPARAAGAPSRRRRGRRSCTWRRFRCATRGARALSADVNRDCREALLEIINHHISGPLKSVEFIAKLSAAGPEDIDEQAGVARHPSRRAHGAAISRPRSASGSASWATRSSGVPTPTTSTCTAAGTTWRCTGGDVSPTGAGQLDHIGLAVPGSGRRRRLGGAPRGARRVARRRSPRPTATAPDRSTSTGRRTS